MLIAQPTSLVATELKVFDKLPISRETPGAALPSKGAGLEGSLPINSTVRANGILTQRDGRLIFITPFSPGNTEEPASFDLGTVKNNPALTHCVDAPFTVDIKVTGKKQSNDEVSREYSGSLVGLVTKPKINPATTPNYERCLLAGKVESISFQKTDDGVDTTIKIRTPQNTVFTIKLDGECKSSSAADAALTGKSLKEGDSIWISAYRFHDSVFGETANLRILGRPGAVVAQLPRLEASARDLLRAELKPNVRIATS